MNTTDEPCVITNNFSLGPVERVCPVCGPHRNGVLGLTGFGPDIDGEFCQRCWARAIAAAIPRLLPPETRG